MAGLLGPRFNSWLEGLALHSALGSIPGKTQQCLRPTAGVVPGMGSNPGFVRMVYPMELVRSNDSFGIEFEELIHAVSMQDDSSVLCTLCTDPPLVHQWQWCWHIFLTASLYFFRVVCASWPQIAPTGH